MKIVQKLLQDHRPAGMTQFPQGFVFDLADAFAGHLEDVAHFFEGAVIAVVDTEAETDHAFLTGGEGL